MKVRRLAVVPISSLITSFIAHGVTFIKYCSILVQALTIQADEDFLYSVFDLTKVKGASWDDVQEE